VEVAPHWSEKLFVLTNRLADKRAWGGVIGPRHRGRRCVPGDQLTVSDKKDGCCEGKFDPNWPKQPPRTIESGVFSLPQIFRPFSGPLSSRPVFVCSYNLRKRNVCSPKRHPNARLRRPHIFFQATWFIRSDRLKKFLSIPPGIVFFWDQPQTPSFIQS
jgi:hypothetical protein